MDYTYDALNRLKTVAYANAVNLNVTYTYDQYTLDANAAPEVFNAGIGRLTQISDASGTTQYRYDDKGNLHTRLNTRAEGITLNTIYQYDAASNLTGLGYPGGITVNYQRNHLAQVTGITLNHNGEEITLASNIAYQGMGPVTNITWGNGLSQLYSYDQSGRVSGYALSSGNKNITFAYDGNNNITQQIDIANQLNNYGYNYDELNRLVEEDGYQHSALPGSQTPYNKSFTYDGVSNRLSKTSGDTTQAYHYSDTSNRLQGVDAENYQFDANGNTLVRASQSWQYNAQNRMASYSEGGVQLASYGYNGQGERVTKQVNGETIHYLYNAAGQLQGEYHYSNGNLTLRQSYVWLGMLPIAMLKEDLTGQTDQLVYIHSDHLNSPRMITDQNQNTVWQWHSSAFGEELPQENGLVFNLRFPGQYYDVESGINYNYYRDYDPASGSYLQSDPIGLVGGVNTYAYVASNPISFFDLFGLSAQDVEKIVDSIHDEVDKMTKNGERMESPYINNLCKNFPNTAGCKNPNNYKDCGEQTEAVNKALDKGTYDDNWSFWLRAGIGHAWGIAVSSNPSDPPIWFDARSDNVSVGEPCSTCAGWPFGMGWGDPEGTTSVPPRPPARKQQ